MQDQRPLPVGAVRVEGGASRPARGIFGDDHDAGPSRLHPATPEPGPDGPAPCLPASVVHCRAGREQASTSVRGGLHGRSLLQPLARAATPQRPRGPRHPAAGEALPEGFQVRIWPRGAPLPGPQRLVGGRGRRPARCSATQDLKVADCLIPPYTVELRRFVGSATTTVARRADPAVRPTRALALGPSQAGHRR